MNLILSTSREFVAVADLSSSVIECQLGLVEFLEAVSPLTQVAGCSIGHNPCLLHVRGWDKDPTKMSKYTSASQIPLVGRGGALFALRCRVDHL